MTARSSSASASQPAPPLLPLRAADALLLVIDIQQRLAPHVADHESLIRRTTALLQAARLFGIPRLLTEHSPEHIGPVIPPLREQFDEADIVRKHCFSAVDEPGFLPRLQRHRRGTVVIAGMEAHVCVMQTALGLRAQGHDVLLVGDAVGSRTARGADRQWALQRLAAAGCRIAGTETVLFEWTGDAARDEFRHVLQLVKNLD